MKRMPTACAAPNVLLSFFDRLPIENSVARLGSLWRRLAVLLAFSMGYSAASAQVLTAPSGLSYAPGMSIGTDDGTHFYLAVDLQWSNTCAAPYVVVETCTNGTDWFHVPGDDVHSVPGSGATSALKKVPEGLTYRFRVFCSDGINNSPPSNVLTIWGEQQPTVLMATVVNASQVTLSWKDNSGSETGFLIEQATNNTFTGTVLRSGAKSNTVVAATLYATNTGFIYGQTYYWRVSATNNQGLASEPSLTASAAPNASPPPPSFFQVRNVPGGVAAGWSSGGGLVDRWYLDVSVGGTNNWRNLYNVSGSGSSYGTGYTWTDTIETPGSICYYRVSASNQVGIASSGVQTVMVPIAIGASVWYVDGAASGNGTGTNWANAFPSFASIGWGNVQPGALIWVAPGTYNEVLYVGADGTSNAPILIKAATTNAPRAGKILLEAAVNYRNYIWLDGAKSDTFTFRSTEQITNNCNWLFYGATNIGRGYFTVATGMHLKWCEFAGPFNDPVNFGEGTVAGVHIQGGVAGDTEVGYCWCHDLAGDGVNWANYTAAINWGAINIHHCLVEHVAGNFMMGSGNVDIHDSILRDWVGPLPRGVHPDGIQVWPDYVRVYNNIIRDTPGEAIYPELAATNGVGMLVYNNIIYGTGAITNANGGIQPNGGITYSTEPGYLIPTMTFSNSLIANNTFYGFDNAYVSVNRRVGECNILQMRGWMVANNLFFTHSTGEQVGLSTNDYTTAQVVFNWNDICGANSMFNYGASDYANPLLFGPATGFNNNISWTPQFVSATPRAGQQFPFDFHLTSGDAQWLVGTNLSDWLPISPGLDRNQDGTGRAATRWPMGALSVSTGTNLVLWFSFNSDFSTNVGKVSDDSGSGADGWMFSPTNWPAMTDRLGGGGAASFTHRVGGQYGFGDYIAITNIQNLDNLSAATFSAWGRYYPALNNDWNNDGVSVFMDAHWSGRLGSWCFGRFHTPYTVFGVMDAYETNADPHIAVQFPDSAVATGNTTNWHHYAVTFDGTRFVGYFDGSPISTNIIAGVTNLIIGTELKWIGVSCWPHIGTPQWGDDPYPNVGWMNGTLDDIRIYNHALSPADLESVYLGGQVLPPVVGGRPAAPMGLRIVNGG